jgi:hypothetical protein
MIDMKKINKLVDLIRGEDWKAAHAMLDEEEFADPGEATVAHWRSVVLRDEGRYQEALEYLKDNQDRFNCQSGVAHKRAWIFHLIGNDTSALSEIALAPFDAEIEDFYGLVMEAKFFRLYLMILTGLPISAEQLAEIPDDYISLFPTGERIPKNKLFSLAQAADELKAD